MNGSFWRLGVEIVLNATGLDSMTGIIRKSGEVELAFASLRKSATSTGEIFGKVFGRAMLDFNIAEAGKDLTGFFYKAGVAAGNYQDRMVKIQMATGGSAAQMDALGANITDLTAGANRTLFNSTQIGDLALSLSQSRLTLDQINRVMPTIAKGADSAFLYKHEDPAMYGKNIGKMVNAFGLADGKHDRELVGAIEEFAKIQRITGMSSSEVVTAEGLGGITFRERGGHFKDFMEFLAMARGAGLSASTAGTSIRAFATRSIPLASITAHGAQAQLEALIDLGFVKKYNIKDARFALQHYKDDRDAVGLPVDFAKMSRGGQEKFARKFLGSQLQSTFSEHLTMPEILAKLQIAHAKSMAAHPGNAKMGESSFLAALTSMAKITAAPLLLYLAKDGAANYKVLVAQIDAQKSLKEMIQRQRELLPQQLMQAPKSLQSLMAMFGGVSRGGEALNYGPLQILTKIMHELNGALSALVIWGDRNRKLMGMLATFAGSAGIVLALTGIFRLVTAVRAFGATAMGVATTVGVAIAEMRAAQGLAPLAGLPVAGAAATVAKTAATVGAETAATTAAAVAAAKLVEGGKNTFHPSVAAAIVNDQAKAVREREAIANLAKADAVRAAQVAAAKNAAGSSGARILGAAGGGARIGVLAEGFGLNKIMAGLIGIVPLMLRFGGGLFAVAKFLPMLIFRFLGWPGIILGIIQALMMFWQSPKLMGHIVGSILKVIIDGGTNIVKGFMWIMGGIWGALMGLLDRVMQVYRDIGKGNFGAVLGDIKKIYMPDGAANGLGNLFDELKKKMHEFGTGVDEANGHARAMPRSGHNKASFQQTINISQSGGAPLSTASIKQISNATHDLISRGIGSGVGASSSNHIGSIPGNPF